MKPNWPTAVVVLAVCALAAFCIYLKEPTPAAVIAIAGTVVAGNMKKMMP